MVSKWIKKVFLLPLIVVSPLAALEAEAGSSGSGNVAAGMKVLKGSCAACHNITGPAAATLKDFNSRKGPDLFYGGIKYRGEWLEGWLAEPERIRPAGFRYFDHLKDSKGGDTIDDSTLKDHVALDAGEASNVAAAIMTLRAGEELVAKGAVEEGAADMFIGEMAFDKFSGCLACHEIEPGYGGLSGPEVYSIARRLQPDFIYAYTKNPQAFDPKSMMPNKELGESRLQQVVKFMIGLADEVLEDDDE